MIIMSIRKSLTLALLESLLIAALIKKLKKKKEESTHELSMLNLLPRL